MINERFARRALISIALLGLVPCGAAVLARQPAMAGWIWAAATVPVVIVIALAVSIVRDLMAGRMGVDAIALLAMAGGLLLGQPLAAIVVAIMYTGGTVLEGYAVSRAERNLKTSIARRGWRRQRGLSFNIRLAASAMRLAKSKAVSLSLT
jgi:cation transport ATPase